MFTIVRSNLKQKFRGTSMCTGPPKADHKSLMEEALRAAPEVLSK